MAKASSVLCPHCLAGNDLTASKNFFAMPTYQCPDCGKGFMYPASLVVLGVAAVVLVFVVSAAVGALIHVAQGARLHEFTGPLAIEILLAAGAGGALIFSFKAKRQVADAERRAQEAAEAARRARVTRSPGSVAKAPEVGMETPTERRPEN